jgi:hypothetical protein
MLYTIVMGDNSGDGHDQTQEVQLDIDLDEKSIEKCIKTGMKLLGWKSKSRLRWETYKLPIWDDYDDNTITDTLEADLTKLGIVLSDEDIEVGLADYDLFLEVWIAVLKYGAAHLDIPVTVKKTNLPRLFIGGYGLCEC